MKLLILLVCLATTTCLAQHKTHMDSSHLFKPIDLSKLQSKIDSTNKAIETSMNNQFKKIQDEEFKRSMEQNNRNLDAFMAARREQEAKQKRQMWIRLSMGFGILAFGIFAMLRRRKKKV